MAVGARSIRVSPGRVGFCMAVSFRLGMSRQGVAECGPAGMAPYRQAVQGKVGSGEAWQLRLGLGSALHG